jgi:hypothetical protein
LNPRGRPRGDPRGRDPGAASTWGESDTLPRHRKRFSPSAVPDRTVSAVSLVAVTLQGLQQAGLVTLAEPDEPELTTVALTEAGLARYKALIERQRARPDP